MEYKIPIYASTEAGPDAFPDGSLGGISNDSGGFPDTTGSSWQWSQDGAFKFVFDSDVANDLYNASYRGLLNKFVLRIKVDSITGSTSPREHVLFWNLAADNPGVQFTSPSSSYTAWGPETFDDPNYYFDITGPGDYEVTIDLANPYFNSYITSITQWLDRARNGPESGFGIYHHAYGELDGWDSNGPGTVVISEMEFLLSTTDAPFVPERIYPESIEPSKRADKLYLVTNPETNEVEWGFGGVGGASIDEAADVPYTPDGNIAATDVHGAIHELDTEKAALASPTFTGDPKAPTPATADNDTSIATTAFVKAQAYAALASPIFTGDPKAPTPATADNDTSIATTAFVQANLALYAKLASPALTGTPTAPTATTGTNTTQVATTAFVAAAVAALVASSPSALDTLNELAAALGNDPNFATTIATSLGLKAPLASPVFTGNPTAPTPSTADNDTSIATTAYVQAQGYAPLASPVLTGDPKAPTPTSGDDDTSIATTAFVQDAISNNSKVVLLDVGEDPATAGLITGQIVYRKLV